MGKRSFFVFTAYIFGLLVLNFLSIIYFAYAPSTERSNLLDLVYKVDTEEIKEGIPVKLVTVNYDGVVKKHLTRSYSPVTALIDLGYSISNKNRIVSTSPISKLYNNSYILVQSYTTTIDEIVYSIPYETIIKGNSLCQMLSESKTEQSGVLGLMVKRVKRIYQGNDLIAEEVIESIVKKEARAEIIVIKGPDDTPDSVPQRGFNCDYWHAYVDNINATDEEKKWLKFTMKWESGCNAERNSGFYKGLFQWSPCIWYAQYPKDNIFDGELQIKRVLEKLRAGANPHQMWPAVHDKYVATYGELSWLQ
jgi:hypothetical protein